MRLLISLLALSTLLFTADNSRAGVHSRRVGSLPGQPFDRHECVDALGRTVTYYLSEKKGEAALPLLVFVQGSGSQPLFPKVEGKIRGSLQNHLWDVLHPHARVLCVEKPGVTPFEQVDSPGTALDASPVFKREHVLDRWTTAIAAALRAAHHRSDIDTSKTLVVGHSEGGLVACRLAANDPTITHVASLAGGGTTQLFDLVELARRGHLYGGAARDPEARAQRLLADWQAVLAAPHDAEALFLGHPNRRWTSFLADSPIDALRDTDARVFLAQGTADHATITAAVDALHADLLVRGRDVTYLRVDGGDHAFARASANERPSDGFRRVFREMRDWFLADPEARKVAAATR
ncbi:MAG: alpha/beta fold hydrolase [Acidobacteriota bacterium]